MELLLIVLAPFVLLLAGSLMIGDPPAEGYTGYRSPYFYDDFDDIDCDD